MRARGPFAAVAGLALASCSSLGKGPELSYGQVQAIQPGLTAAQVVDAFGEPGRLERGPGGRVVLMDYAALDAKQGRARLILGFDDREVLRDKRFTGAVLKP
jgi:hypothetical protein